MAQIEGPQTLIDPERLMFPVQSKFSDTLTSVRREGSITGVRDTPLGTVLSYVSARHERWSLDITNIKHAGKEIGAG